MSSSKLISEQQIALEHQDVDIKKHWLARENFCKLQTKILFLYFNPAFISLCLIVHVRTKYSGCRAGEVAKRNLG